MDISTFRREVLGVSQETFARLVGLSSKSRVCEIERDNKCSARVALAIEQVSGGQVRAEDISPAVALIRSTRPVARKPQKINARKTVSESPAEKNA